MFLFLTLLIFAVTAASMYSVGELGTATSDSADTVDSIRDTVDRALELNDDLRYTLTLAESNATELAAVDPAQGTPVLNSIQAALTDVEDVADSGDAFRSDTDETSDDIA